MNNFNNCYVLLGGKMYLTRTHPLLNLFTIPYFQEISRGIYTKLCTKMKQIITRLWHTVKKCFPSINTNCTYYLYQMLKQIMLFGICATDQ